MLRFFVGLLLVVAGCLILLTNLGLVDPLAADLVFQALFRLWPAVLVVWGISLIFHRQPRLARLLALLVVAGGVAALVSFQQVLTPAAGEPAQPLRIPFPDQEPLREAHLYLRAGIGRVELAPGSADLVQGALRGLGRPVQVTTFPQGGTAEVGLVQALPSPLTGFLWPQAATAAWQVGLHPGVPWSLDLRLVSGVLDLDARGLPLHGLYLDATASSLRCYLPGPGAFPAPPEAPIRMRLDLVSSRLDLTVPADAGVSLTLRGGLGPWVTGEGLEARGLIRDGDRYVSPNFPEATVRYQIDLILSLSTLHLIWGEAEPAPAPAPPATVAPAEGLPPLVPEGIASPSSEPRLT